LIEDLQMLPEGLTELALHPSTKDGVPYPKLRGNREREALLDQAFLSQLARLGVELTTWEGVTR
jgi:hypothetical protein